MRKGLQDFTDIVGVGVGVCCSGEMDDSDDDVMDDEDDSDDDEQHVQTNSKQQQQQQQLQNGRQKPGSAAAARKAAMANGNTNGHRHSSSEGSESEPESDLSEEPAAAGKQKKQQKQQQQKQQQKQQPQADKAAGKQAGGKAGFYAETQRGFKQDERTFQDLNLSRPLLRAVAALGYTQPTPIQVRTRQDRGGGGALGGGVFVVTQGMQLGTEVVGWGLLGLVSLLQNVGGGLGGGVLPVLCKCFWLCVLQACIVRAPGYSISTCAFAKPGEGYAYKWQACTFATGARVCLRMHNSIL